MAAMSPHDVAPPGAYHDPILLTLPADDPGVPAHRWAGTYRTDDGVAEGPVEARLGVDPTRGRVVASVSVEEGYVRLVHLAGTLDADGHVALRSAGGDFEVAVQGRLVGARLTGAFALIDTAGQRATGTVSLRAR